jgi:hypothetical protein
MRGFSFWTSSGSFFQYVDFILDLFSQRSGQRWRLSRSGFQEEETTVLFWT